MKSPCSRSIQVELGKVEGFWSKLQLLQQALAKYLNFEHQTHWLQMWKKPMSCAVWETMWLYQIELEPISLHHLHHFSFENMVSTKILSSKTVSTLIIYSIYIYIYIYIYISQYYCSYFFLFVCLFQINAALVSIGDLCQKQLKILPTPNFWLVVQDRTQTFWGACAKTEKGHPPPPPPHTLFFGHILMAN